MKENKNNSIFGDLKIFIDKSVKVEREKTKNMSEIEKLIYIIS